MSQPIFPKGTKVVKGKVVQRLQGSSRVKEQKLKYRKGAEDAVIMDAGGDAGMRAHYTSTNDPEFNKAVIRLIQEGRTGPRLAPGQKSIPKVLKKLGFDPEEGDYVAERGPMGDPRQQRELPKVKPGRPRPVLPERREAFVGANDDPMAPDDASPTYYGGAKASDKRDRRKNPAMEGRGSGFLSKIQEAMGGKPMPAPLLAQLKGLDPKKLEAILAVLNKSKTDVPTHGLGDRGTITIDPSGNLKNRNKKYDTDIPF